MRCYILQESKFRFMKGVSPLIAMVLVIAFGFAAMAIVLTVVNPLLDRAKDSGIVNEATQNMQLLDSAIKAVASEAKGSKRTIHIKITEGVLRNNASVDQVYFDFEPRTRTILDGFAGDVRIESRPIFLEYFNRYSDGANANDTWTAVNGSWSISSGRFLGNGGINYHNIGNVTGFDLAATIVPSVAPNGQVFLIPADPSNLVLYLPFDGNVNTSETTVYDYSPYKNNGTLQNITSATCGTNNACPSWVTGNFGNATQYDGIGDFVNVSNEATYDFANQSFTVLAWINPVLVSTPFIITKIADAANTNQWQISIGINSILTCDLLDNSANIVYRVSGQNSAITNNSWNYITCVFNTTKPEKVDSYINGVINEGSTTNNTATRTYNIQGNTTVNIGARASSSTSIPFNGTIDEVMIFNRALSTTEITFLYETSIKKITTGGEIPNIRNGANISLVLSSPSSTYFDNIKVKAGPPKIRFVIPYQNIDVVNQTRFGPGDHNIVIRHYGTNTTSNKPMIGLEE